MSGAEVIPIITAITGAVGAGAAMKAAGQKPKEEEGAPTPDDKASLAERQRMMQRKYAGQGRASTMLSGSNTLG